MIPFFRKIRKQLADDSQFLKYSRYAFGEIVLVVAGILIALQINNWNENRKDSKTSRSTLEEFKKDLASDTTGINRVVTLLERQTSYEAWALQRVSYEKTQIDSLRKAFYGPVYQEFVQDRTYNKLQISQNPNLTGFLDLQNKLTLYYTDTKFLLDYFNQDEKQFYQENNTDIALRKELEIDLADFPTLASKIEQTEVLINYAETIEGRNYIKANYDRRRGMINYFNKVKEEAIQLIQQIDTKLENDD